MRAVIGHSDEIETAEAIEAAIAECEAELKGEQPKAALVFMSTDYEHALALDMIAEHWPDLPVVGGSTDGELSSERGFVHDSILLTLLVGDDFEAQVGLGPNLSGGIDEAVESALSGLNGRQPAVCLTTFAPSTDSSSVIRALDQRLGIDRCPVLGGLTGDHREFSRTAEFVGREVLQDALPLLFLFGDIKVSWGIGSGWFPIGEPHVVTESEGNVVSKIDDRPATDVYQDYWGEVPIDSLGEYPLAVFPETDDGPSFLRAAMGADPETGSIRFAGDVPTGARVRVTEVLSEGILSGTESSVQTALERYPGSRPDLALVFSCAARKWVLGAEAEKEIGLLNQHCGNGHGNFPLAGFYCFGEIAPFEYGQAGRFHNETCITVLLGT